MKFKFTIFILTSFSIAIAQDQDSLMLKFSEFSNRLYSKPVNYLEGEELLNRYKEHFTGTQLESFYHQISGTYYAASGNQLKAKKHFWLSKKQCEDSLKQIQNSLEDYRNIFQHTANRKVVMINENHSFPEHRVFTTSLLDSLFKQGFKYLALEDLVNKTEINNRINPSSSDGLYINEIMFAEMVRKARKIGFTLIAYDNNNAWDISERDSLATIELKRFFDKNPDSKMIIHCGFGHIDKSENVLASFIRSEIGIDPLTISQTSLIPVMANLPISEPKIIKGVLNAQLFGVQSDFQIIHPIYQYNERPDYLFVNGRERVQIDLDFEFSETLILEVYQTKILEETVPFDRLRIDSNINNVEISIPRGRFTVLFKNLRSAVVKEMYIIH